MAIQQAPEGGLWLSGIDLRVAGESPLNPFEGARLRFFTRTGERLLHTDEEAALRLVERERRTQAEEEAEVEPGAPAAGGSARGRACRRCWRSTGSLATIQITAGEIAAWM